MEYLLCNRVTNTTPPSKTERVLTELFGIRDHHGGLAILLEESFRHELLRVRVDVLIVVHGPDVREDECTGYSNVVQYDVGGWTELTDQG